MLSNYHLMQFAKILNHSKVRILAFVKISKYSKREMP